MGRSVNQEVKDAQNSPPTVGILASRGDFFTSSEAKPRYRMLLLY
jgi:hypothetical protein